MVLNYSLVLLAQFYERFLFLNFTSFEAVAIAVAQRMLLQVTG